MSKEVRRGCVKDLRALERDLDVTQVRDDSGRAKVQDMFEAVVIAAKKEEARAEAEGGESLQVVRSYVAGGGQHANS